MTPVGHARAKRPAAMTLALSLLLLCFATMARGQDGMTRVGDDDYLTGGEISAVRDAQEADKRLILYMDFAQRRIDAVKQALASGKSGAGHAVQKTLVEYVRILEALESTVEDARERRVPLEKAFKDIELRGREFLKYLESLDPDSAPGWDDYQYTIEEAIDMTTDELAEVARGMFPEVQERTPPRELPGLPSSRPPSRPAPLPADGPPRKSDPPASEKPAPQKPSQDPGQEEEGPPRKSQGRPSQ